MAVMFKLLISSTYYSQTWLRYILCLTRAVLIPQRSDKLISRSNRLLYFGMHHYLSSDVTKSSLHMQQRWRRETDGITLASRGTPETLLGHVSLSLSLSFSLFSHYRPFLYFSLFALLPLPVTLSGGPASAVDTAISK